MNFKAQTIYELVDLEKVADTEPPQVMDLSKEELMDVIETPLHFNLPCVTTAVERAVRVTTEAANISTDKDQRDGYSFQRVSARKRNIISEKTNDKKQWNIK